MTQPPVVLAQFGTWLFAALVLSSAVLVVTLDNLFRAALSLGAVLVGVAALFIIAGAEFLGFVQILIYVGAILTLVIFAVMLTTRTQGPVTPPSHSSGGVRDFSPGNRSAISQGPRAASAPRRWPAAAASIGLFALLASAIQAVAARPVPGRAPVTLAHLGQELVTTLVLPFEVISVVFVASIVGAVAIAASKAPPK